MKRLFLPILIALALVSIFFPDLLLSKIFGLSGAVIYLILAIVISLIAPALIFTETLSGNMYYGNGNVRWNSMSKSRKYLATGLITIISLVMAAFAGHYIFAHPSFLEGPGKDDQGTLLVFAPLLLIPYLSAKFLDKVVLK
jgi:hypothetical protein